MNAIGDWPCSRGVLFSLRIQASARVASGKSVLIALKMPITSEMRSSVSTSKPVSSPPRQARRRARREGTLSDELLGGEARVAAGLGDAEGNMLHVAGDWLVIQTRRGFELLSHHITPVARVARTIMAAAWQTPSQRSWKVTKGGSKSTRSPFSSIATKGPLPLGTSQ